MTKDNGGPAFPIIGQAQIGVGMAVKQAGISVRDYFAAAALTGLLARGPLAGDADMAYEYADAMMKARGE